MKSGKKVFGIIIISLLLIGSVSFVSASWKDWFGFGEEKNLSGELPESATAKVKILDTNPPVVVYVSNVDDGQGTVNTVIPNIRTVSSGNTPVKLWFLAQQGGGVGNLDPTAGSIHSNASFVRTGSTTRFNSSCVTLGQVACGTLCSGTAVNYSCTITMRYYDDPATNWNISATARDSTNRFGVNSTKQFNVQSVSAGSSAVNYLNWTTPPLTTSDPDRYSDNNYMVDNDANSAIPNTRVNATQLKGTTLATDVILASTFTAHYMNPATCGGITLGQDTNPIITGFTVPKATSDAGSQAELHFCLDTAGLIGLSSQDYNATRPWIITFTG